MKTNFILSKYVFEHVIELSEEHDGIVSLDDLNKFKEVATEYDEKYINQSISKCAMWTLKKDWNDKYCEIIKRDEIKVLERVKHRVTKLKK